MARELGHNNVANDAQKLPMFRGCKRGIPWPNKPAASRSWSTRYCSLCWRPKGVPLFRYGISAFRLVFIVVVVLVKSKNLHCVDFLEEILQGEGADRGQTLKF